MLLDFETEPKATYCLSCRSSEAVQVRRGKNGKEFVCGKCGAVNDRALIIDPDIEWWKAADNTYWHKSAGVILVDRAGKVLLFRLTKFPYGSSFPAGHVNTGEDPRVAVIRETEEETGLVIENPKLLVHTDIHNDSCSRGSDDHEWFLFGAHTDDETLDLDPSEGKDAVWVALEDLGKYDLPPAASFLVNNFAEPISAFVKGGLK